MQPDASGPGIPDSPDPFPLFARFPALRQIPRVRLCDLPSPVLAVDVASGGEMWIKRDDLNAPVCGGNKARSLEFLLGGLGDGDSVITMGGAGSTHVLCTAVHAARIGVSVEALRWRQEMNPVARIVSDRVTMLLGRPPGRSVSLALLNARYSARKRNLRLIPIGGSTPHGVLGHVNAGMELAAQIDNGDLPRPDRIVLPLASGGTSAGLLLGLKIAGLDIEVVGARVGPRLFVNRYAVLHLARRTRALIRSITGEDPGDVTGSRFRIVQHVYAGAYGRPLPAASQAANILQESAGIRLDDTYSAKAWVAALDELRSAGGPVLFWLTFDARCLTN